ncbi:MAG: hypothetical protein GY828_01605 [Candidatus Gracilibacteria bacterium]|nr:hypothetical protein [Candidatus Gracilibacteria bacterium]
MTFACMVHANEEETSSLDIFSELSELLGEDQPVNDDLSDLLSDDDSESEELSELLGEDDESESEDLSNLLGDSTNNYTKVKIFHTNTTIPAPKYVNKDITLGKFRTRRECSHDLGPLGSVVNIYFNDIGKHFKYGNDKEKGLLQNNFPTFPYNIKLCYNKYNTEECVSNYANNYYHIPDKTDIKIVLEKKDYPIANMDELVEKWSNFGLTIKTRSYSPCNLDPEFSHIAVHNESFSIYNDKISLVHIKEEIKTDNRFRFRFIRNNLDDELLLTHLNFKVPEKVREIEGIQLRSVTDNKLIWSILNPSQHIGSEMMPMLVNHDISDNTGYDVDTSLSSLGLAINNKKTFFDIIYIPKNEGVIITEDPKLDSFGFRLNGKHHYGHFTK